MQAGADVTIRAASHTISALLARSFAQVPRRQPPAAVLVNSTILPQEGSLGWKLHCYVFFPDSDLHILNHFKDGHRTKISSDTQVSFGEGCGGESPTSTLYLGWEETEPPSNRDSSKPGLVSTRGELTGRHMSMTQP